jgi:hypothetical protein
VVALVVVVVVVVVVVMVVVVVVVVCHCSLCPVDPGILKQPPEQVPISSGSGKQSDLAKHCISNLKIILLFWVRHPLCLCLCLSFYF